MILLYDPLIRKKRMIHQNVHIPWAMTYLPMGTWHFYHKQKKTPAVFLAIWFYNCEFDKLRLPNIFIERGYSSKVINIKVE